MNWKTINIHQFEKLAYGVGHFCIYFLVFVHKYIIKFVTCVYKIDTTRKMSKLKTDINYL